MFASICNAQGQELKLVEKLPDGSFVVSIDGIEHRAITGEKAVELAKNKIDLVACQANEKRFNDLVTIEKQNVTIAQQQTEIQKGNFHRAMAMYEGERKLREQASQFVPHGKVEGLGGKVLNFLDSQWFQVAWKIIPDAVQTYRAVKQ